MGFFYDLFSCDTCCNFGMLMSSVSWMPFVWGWVVTVIVSAVVGGVKRI